MYEEAQKLVVDKKFIEAKEKVELIIEILPFKNEAGNTYFSFGSALELFLYTLVFQPQGIVNQTKTDNSAIYHLYGYIQAQLYRIPEAILALENSMKWDPVNVSSLLELAEISRLQGEYDKFLGIIKNALALSFSRSELSSCYTKLAQYYKEKEEYETAVCLYYVSQSFTNKQFNMSELARLKIDLNVDTNPPRFERIKEVLEQNSIQLGVSDYVINATTALAKQAKSNNAFEIYKYCKDVYKELTNNELDV